MEPLYEYLSTWFNDGRSERVVCQGRLLLLRSLLRGTSFQRCSGATRFPKIRAAETIWAFGVRERGASFQVSSDEPKLRLKVRTP